MLWQPSEKWTIKGTFFTVTTETEGALVGQAPYEESLFARIPGVKPRGRDEVDIFSLKVDYEFDWATLTLIASTWTARPITSVRGGVGSRCFRRTYAFTETLELTGGARVTDMEQTLEDSTAETSDFVVSPKGGVAWWPVEGTLTYFNVTTGFRPGNINLGQEFNARIPGLVIRSFQGFPRSFPTR